MRELQTHSYNTYFFKHITKHTFTHTLTSTHTHIHTHTLITIIWYTLFIYSSFTVVHLQSSYHNFSWTNHPKVLDWVAVLVTILILQVWYSSENQYTSLSTSWKHAYKITYLYFSCQFKHIITHKKINRKDQIH